MRRFQRAASGKNALIGTSRPGAILHALSNYRLRRRVVRIQARSRIPMPYDLLLRTGSGAYPGAQTPMIRVITLDESNRPAAAVRLELRRAGAVVGSAVTNEKGEAEFPLPAPGGYEITAAKEEFETLTQPDLTVAAGAPIEVRFVMVPKIKIGEKIDVTASAASAAPWNKGPPFDRSPAPAGERFRRARDQRGRHASARARHHPHRPGAAQNLRDEREPQRDARQLRRRDRPGDGSIRDDRAGGRRQHDQRLQDALPVAVRAIHGGRGLGRNPARRRQMEFRIERPLPGDAIPERRSARIAHVHPASHFQRTAHRQQALVLARRRIPHRQAARVRAHLSEQRDGHRVGQLLHAGRLRSQRDAFHHRHDARLSTASEVLQPRFLQPAAGHAQLPGARLHWACSSTAGRWARTC